jgi:hypothetical protein
MIVTCEDLIGNPVAGYVIARTIPPVSTIATIVSNSKTDDFGEGKVLVIADVDGTAFVKAEVECGINFDLAEVIITQCDDDQDCDFLDDQCNDGICVDNSCLRDPSLKAGAQCVDLFDCTENEVCSEGNCIGLPNDELCSDDNSCTDDYCIVGIGCFNPNNTDPCDDGLFCNGLDTCSGGGCSNHEGNPCLPLICDEELDVCLDMNDYDQDGISDSEDNCPFMSNPNQEDTLPPAGNDIGDACDCEGNFDCDYDVDGNDAATFKVHFGRSQQFNPCSAINPCNGDFTCDGDVDGGDAFKFKEDFGRSSFKNPCPVCEVGEWCLY